MDTLINKYTAKLVQAGLADAEGLHQPLVGGLDDVLVWNRSSEQQAMLEPVFSGLNINSLIFLRPKEPYSSLISHLAQDAADNTGLIEPKDCETRTFLHDLPVIDTFDPAQIISVLKKRKSVIISPEKDLKNHQKPAIIAPGNISPEQGFVTISSVCFACFVKFFTDYLEDLQLKKARPSDHDLFDRVKGLIQPSKKTLPKLIHGPFLDEPTIYNAVIEAGLKTVEYDLVDSYFGNVSYCTKDTIYISQTASSLDELSGCIDPVPLDNSTSAGLTASSELSAHLKTIEMTKRKAILHGHPKFCVILSMDCDPIKKKECPFKDKCHIKCPEKRLIHTTPIVPGEVGTGPTGLCNTLPKALAHSNAAIVYGHGLFTTGKNDFTDAFKTMLEVEARCRETYLQKVAALRKASV